MNNFRSVTQKILPVAVVLAGLAGCQRAPVAAEASSKQNLTRVPVVAPAGSVLRVRLDQALDTKRSRPGDRFTGVLDSPLVANRQEVLPKGTIVEGHVLNARASGRLKGRAVLSLTLDSCIWNGRNVPLTTKNIARTSTSHKKRNWALIGGGSGTGALVGGLVAGPVGAAAGAGSGAAVGTAGAALSGRKNVAMPAESVVSFTLRNDFFAD